MTQDECNAATAVDRLTEPRVGLEFWTTDTNSLSRPRLRVVTRIVEPSDENDHGLLVYSRDVESPTDDPRYEAYTENYFAGYTTADAAIRAAIAWTTWWCDERIKNWRKQILEVDNGSIENI